jgi:glycosyltransferase involved in cell wall biosynthesis
LTIKLFCRLLSRYSSDFIYLGHCGYTIYNRRVRNCDYGSNGQGKPIVATNVGGIMELLKDGKTGLLVPSKDPIALAEKITYLMINKNEAKIIGLRAKEESKIYDIQSHSET